MPTITHDIPCPTCDGTQVVTRPWEQPSEQPCPGCDDGTHYDVECELPWRYDVCPVCEGKGTHVNPSIDASGLTAADFDDDPDFRDDYMSGHYDQTCNRCQGKRVVPVVDEERADPDDLKRLDDDAADEAAYRAECAAEIRAGC